MGYQKSSSYLATLSVALCVALAPFSFQAPQLRAQPLYVSINFPRTPVGSPRKAFGGGTRGGGSTALTVLSPQSNVITTVSAQPTLFWYIPKTAAKSAEFEVHDAQKKRVFHTTFALQGIPGVVKLTLPKTVALETNKEYQWTLMFQRAPEQEGESLWLQGKIKRTALTSVQKAQLAAARQPLQQADVYARAGIWQETISILAQLHQDRPRDRTINSAWQELLESVELKEIAKEPLIECCRADN